MILEFMGNAPRNNFLRIGVNGNNLVDDLVFILGRTQGKNDLFDFTPKIKISTKEGDFAEYSGDDLVVEHVEERDTVKITYVLPKLITERGNVDMQLVFEKELDDETVKQWQTLPFNVTFPESINESEAIIVAYPNIIRELKEDTQKAVDDSAAAVETANEAKETADEAKETSENAVATANEAKEIAESVVGAEINREIAEAERATAETDRASAETARGTAESDRASAEATRQANETARENAEAARETAETARATAETDRASAEAARETAETARAAAETDRASAETARGTAEAARAAAETNRASAETARDTAEAARATAETNRASAEIARETAEAARAAAETDRASAETARGTAEAARAAAETNRASAETARDTAEAARATAETNRASAEIARETAEAARAAAETNRASAETNRGTAEAARATAETDRESAETNRGTAEAARAAAESDRASAETARNTAESARVAAENARVAAEEERVEEMQRIASTLNAHHYTAKWNKTTAQMTRLNDAAFITTDITNFAHRGSINANYSNPFDNIYPWSGRKLCNIDIDRYRALVAGESLTKCVKAWEGDVDFSYDDPNGVWVYTPEFWGKSWDDGTYRYFDVTDKACGGYVYYPESIEGRWHGRAVTRVIDGTEKTCLLPTVGMLAKRTALSTLHTYAKNWGATLDSIFSVDANTLLMVVEFASMNSQDAIGSGVSNLYRESSDRIQAASTGTVVKVLKANASATCIPGAIFDIGTANGGINVGSYQIVSVETDSQDNTILNVTLNAEVTVTAANYWSVHGLCNMVDSEIGSKSGYIGTNGKSIAYYRGMEMWGNMFFYILGAYRQTGTERVFIAHDDEEADAADALNASLHIDTGITLASSGNYIKKLGTLSRSGLLSIPPFCTEVAGDSGNPVGDYFYIDTSAGNTVLILGGHADNAARVGAFCGYWHDSASGSGWSYAARPRLKPWRN